MEEVISRISRKVSEGADGEILATKLSLRLWANQIGRKYKILQYIFVTEDFAVYYRFRKGSNILPDISRSDRHDLETQTSAMVRRHHNSHQRKHRKTRSRRTRIKDKNVTSWLQTKLK